MKIVLQRVTKASVEIDGKFVGRIGNGLVVLLGIEKEDSIKDVQYLAEKTVNLRVFEDEKKKLNRSLSDTSGEMLIVSQFTLASRLSKREKTRIR